MDKHRCFIAIKVDPGRQYYEFINSYKSENNIKFKLVEPSNYHFTLHFFGDLVQSEINKVENILKNLELTQFDFSLKSPGSLPRNKLSRTRVLYIEPSLGKQDIMQPKAMLLFWHQTVCLLNRNAGLNPRCHRYNLE